MKILITGASKGIGRECAERLLRKGHECILVARSVDSMRQTFQPYKDGARVVRADLKDFSEIQSVFVQCSDLFPLDAFIHCAGVAPLSRIDENTPDLVRETFEINVFSFIEFMRLFIGDGVCREGASVVAMSSVVAHRGSNRQSVYSATKAALEALARCMSKELLERKIRVNTLVSAVVETDMLKKLREESVGLDEKIKHHTPLGIVPASEICDLIEYLISPSAIHITGASIQVDSGFLL